MTNTLPYEQPRLVVILNHQAPLMVVWGLLRIIPPPTCFQLEWVEVSNLVNYELNSPSVIVLKKLSYL